MPQTMEPRPRRDPALATVNEIAKRIRWRTSVKDPDESQSVAAYGYAKALAEGRANLVHYGFWRALDRLRAEHGWRKGKPRTPNRRFAGRVTIKGRLYYLGQFDTRADAQAAQRAKRRELVLGPAAASPTPPPLPKLPRDVRRVLELCRADPFIRRRLVGSTLGPRLRAFMETLPAPARPRLQSGPPRDADTSGVVSPGPRTR
jgi:hypothetical protein